MSVIAFAWSAGACAQTDDAGFAPITPYRPTVSNPAQLPAAGQLEAEVGGLRSRSSDLRRESIPYLLKLGVDKDWGVLVGGEAQVWQHDLSAGGDEARAHGVGDTTLTLKRAFVVDDATAFGLEFGATFPTAKDGLGTGSGKTDWTLNGIFSRDFGPVHLDANLNATRLGAPDTGTGRTQAGASASLSTALAEHWGVTGELSGTRQSGVPHESQLLGALTYSPSKFLTVDIGLARAWRPTPGTTSVFAGVVFPIAKLW